MKFNDFLQQENKVEAEPLTEGVQDSLQNIVDSLTQASHVAQTAHWNLRSGAFVAIHPWLGDVYGTLAGMADEVAEQIKISDINLMVSVGSIGTFAGTDEQQLFVEVGGALQGVKNSLENAARDPSLSRVLQNLIDGWIATIDKMIWFVKASIK